MVDFDAVYDIIEEHGGWDHLTTNGDDGYSIWINAEDTRYQLVFYNWDTYYSEDPCGLRVDDTEEEDVTGYYRKIALVVLEDIPDVEEAVKDFLEDVDDLIG
jgi:hypothetical protein